MKRVLIACVCLAAAFSAQAFQMNPDGSILPDGDVTMAPDGTYHSGDTTSMTPNGTFVGGRNGNTNTSMNPDGSFTSGDYGWQQPNGRYSSSPNMEMFPNQSQGNPYSRRSGY